MFIQFLNATDVNELRRKKKSFPTNQQQKLHSSTVKTTSFTHINATQFNHCSSHQADDGLFLKLDWSVCICLTQLQDGTDMYRIYYIKNNYMFRHFTLAIFRLRN